MGITNSDLGVASGEVGEGGGRDELVAAQLQRRVDGVAEHLVVQPVSEPDPQQEGARHGGEVVRQLLLSGHGRAGVLPRDRGLQAGQ